MCVHARHGDFNHSSNCDRRVALCIDCYSWAISLPPHYGRSIRTNVQQQITLYTLAWQLGSLAAHSSYR
jgi:hypothetical protein